MKSTEKKKQQHRRLNLTTIINKGRVQMKNKLDGNRKENIPSIGMTLTVNEKEDEIGNTKQVMNLDHKIDIKKNRAKMNQVRVKKSVVKEEIATLLKVKRTVTNLLVLKVIKTAVINISQVVVVVETMQRKRFKKTTETIRTLNMNIMIEKEKNTNPLPKKKSHQRSILLNHALARLVVRQVKKKKYLRSLPNIANMLKKAAKRNMKKRKRNTLKKTRRNQKESVGIRVQNQKKAVVLTQVKKKEKRKRRNQNARNPALTVRITGERRNMARKSDYRMF
uniref:Uncharacterized protein n=1 Tax=Cacopsylla melanoneura TaxID=428564 RepID=A0A8D8M9C8_9HEMI